MATRAAVSDLPAADLCLRTSDAGIVELYVFVEGKKYGLRVASVDLHKIESPGILIADIVAPISKLG
jgi:hypothetical protein